MEQMETTLERVKRFRAKFEELSEEFESDGIKLNLGNISYDDTSFSVRLSGSFTDEDLKELVEDKKKLNFVVNVKMKHPKLNPECFNKTFKFRGKTFKLVDYISKRSKYPFVAETVGQNKKSAFPEDILLDYFSIKN